ncbi:HTH-type transcriptional regulator DmlR [Pseudoalteromonas sp. CIP111854]|uniref:HTH-type transcriptional regulator DmlR n=1 Tax=Pseudoalteromonas holothuriae TaxID=2963714 RepID=A0A9W4QQX8_9GAMM|nr:LysR family transcriptional regulator [Pseudoalteromonas sp. CIP111854]CAH9049400.1 HTH-type transcriptional regulator DmlR [Pseudoalteromonas sp. CIP111854]
MIDELRALAIFAETVKKGSFRRAARSLGLSPSVVSYQVSNLEKKLHVALLYRSTRSLSLTSDGKALYQHALMMLEAAQSGLDTVTNNKEQLRGELTITLPTALIKAPLTQKLAQFSKHHPMLSLNLEYKDERSNLIEEGVDLAIRAGTMADSNLKSKRIGEIKRLIVCSSAFFKSQPKPIAISDIAHWNWISLAMLSNARMLKNNQGEHYKIEYKSNISVNSICAMVEMCEQGVGVATPPDYLVAELIASHSLVHLFPEWKVEDIPLYAVWPNNVPQQGLVKILLSYINE